MIQEMIQEIREIEMELKEMRDKDYKDMKAKEFSDLLCSFLLKGKIKKEFKVSQRGDGKSGRIDILYEVNGKRCGIELDRLTPRKKSVFKLLHGGFDYAIVITRAPFKIHIVL